MSRPLRSGSVPGIRGLWKQAGCTSRAQRRACRCGRRGYFPDQHRGICQPVHQKRRLYLHRQRGGEDHLFPAYVRSLHGRDCRTGSGSPRKRKPGAGSLCDRALTGNTGLENDHSGRQDVLSLRRTDGDSRVDGHLRAWKRKSPISPQRQCLRNTTASIRRAQNDYSKGAENSQRTF